MEDPNIQNEKGLIKEEFDRSSLENVEKSSRVMLAGAVLAIGGFLGGFSWALGPYRAPEGYQTYTDLHITLATLQHLREKQSPLNRTNLPYQTGELRESLESFFDYSPEKIQKLEESISLIESDRARMKQEHPEYPTHREKLSSGDLGNLGLLLGKTFLPTVPGFALIIGYAAFATRRRRNLGTYIWEEQDQEEAQTTS